MTLSTENEDRDRAYDPAPTPGHAGGGTDGVSRRDLLVRSGVLASLGLVPAIGTSGVAYAHDGGVNDGDGSAGGGHDGPALPVWASTRSGDRYLALGGTGEEPRIVELTVGSDGDVSLGDQSGVHLPEGFEAMVLHAAGGELLVAGGQSADDGTTRPVLYRVVGDHVLELPLGVTVPYGVATGLAARGGGHLALLIEGADTVEQGYNDVTRVAESFDAGRTWRLTTLAADLGEGYPAHLTSTTSSLFAVTVDVAGRRQAYQRPSRPTDTWSALGTVDGHGAVLAVVPHGSASADVLDVTSDGAVRRLRWDADGHAWRDAGVIDIGQPVVSVVPVAGGDDLVAVGRSRAHLVGRG